MANPATSFADPDFFDEIPLYARYKEVEFLKQYGDVNSLLIELSLEYLERVASDQPHSRAGEWFLNNAPPTAGDSWRSQ